MNTSQHMSSKQKPPLGVFVALTIVLFFCTLSALDSIGFVPTSIDGGETASAETISTSNTADTKVSDTVPDVQASPEVAVNPVIKNIIAKYTPISTVSSVVPRRIIIGSVGMNLPVQNPSTRDVAALDALLVNGPARYSASAHLGEVGNVVIFAHSSHLPIVHNKMFQAFNNVPSLNKGETITLVGSDSKQYLYSVESVVRADVEAGTSIDLSSSVGKKLTLVTCDTLTGKSARFILTASFVGTE